MNKSGLAFAQSCDMWHGDTTPTSEALKNDVSSHWRFSWRGLTYVFILCVKQKASQTFSLDVNFSPQSSILRTMLRKIPPAVIYQSCFFPADCFCHLLPSVNLSCPSFYDLQQLLLLSRTGHSILCQHRALWFSLIWRSAYFLLSYIFCEEFSWNTSRE